MLACPCHTLLAWIILRSTNAERTGCAALTSSSRTRNIQIDKIRGCPVHVHVHVQVQARPDHTTKQLQYQQLPCAHRWVRQSRGSSRDPAWFRVAGNVYIRCSPGPGSLLQNLPPGKQIFEEILPLSLLSQPPEQPPWTFRSLSPPYFILFILICNYTPYSHYTTTAHLRQEALLCSRIRSIYYALPIRYARH